MFIKTEALVLREIRYKEADRILTVYSSGEGKFSVKARGALRKTSKLAAPTQQLTYSSFVLFRNNDRWYANEAEVIDSFEGLRTDIIALSLGSYVAECVDAVSIEGQPEPGMLQLALNTLYAISNQMYEQTLIKSVFELRLMSITGYMPDLRACCVCGSEMPESAVFNVSEGTICCRHCARNVKGMPVFIGGEGLKMMRYVTQSPPKRIFSYKMSSSDLRGIAAATEAYLLHNTDRRFGTLDYYKSLTQFTGTNS